MLRRKAAKYLQLDGPAQLTLNREIENYCAWHRREMLPAYAVLCRRMAKGVRGGENFEDNVRFVMPQITELYHETLKPMAGPIAVAMLSLNAQGLHSLQTAFDDANAEEKKRNLDDPDAARKRRAQRTLLVLREFTGELTKEQEKQITEITMAFPMPLAAWQAQREFHQGELIGILKTKRSLAAVENCLTNWWLAPQSASTDKDAAEMDDREVTRFFKEILEILTPIQRENVAERLEAYASDFDELAAQSKLP
jgi:hypothetical protein